jgi:hypothetical protein
MNGETLKGQEVFYRTESNSVISHEITWKRVNTKKKNA